jgi:succinylglutamate desuccinylase
MRPPRILAAAGPPGSGPLLIVIGGLHGNEPAGITAALEVGAEVDGLVAAGLALGGRFVALAGNCGALAVGERYLDRDLNRLWAGAELARAEAAPSAPAYGRAGVHPGAGGGEPRERAELRELKAAIEAELVRAGGEVSLLDLHSTSAPGAPFCIVGDADRTIAVAESIGVPLLLGLEGTVAGTLLAHFGASGRVAMCLEGGESGDPATVRHHAAAIRSILVRLGIVPAGSFASLAADRAAIARSAGGLPRRIEVLYRHALARGERFAMLPGFANFQEVRAGQVLATSDRAGGTEVRAPFDGLLVMPRYQGRGEDGFFLGRAVEEAEA